MFILALPTTLEIVHLCCYIIGVLLGAYVAIALDYTKFVRIRSNAMVYIIAITIALCIAFIIGEFLFKILTLFIN